MDNDVDFSTGVSSYRHNRFEFFDFGAPSYFFESRIYSRRNTESFSDGNFFRGIFDTPSYILLGATFLLLTVYFWVGEASSLSSAGLRVFALYFSSEEPTLAGVSKPGHLITVGLLLFSSLVLRTCFSGQIISKMVAKEKPWNIDSMQDLLAHPEISIIVGSNSSPHRHIKEMGSLVSNPIDARRLLVRDGLKWKQVISVVTRTTVQCIFKNVIFERALLA